MTSASTPSSAQFRPFSLFILVFLSGACLMALELLAARSLWNNFGSSVFVWGSVLSVFMGALAIGYFGGGKLADRKPSPHLLGGVVAASGLWSLALVHLAPGVANWVDEAGFGLRTGPMLAALILFLPPSVLMGMVSPFAVKLHTSKVSKVGSAAGTLYALSTCGSLAGTLLTTFVLIPAMPSRWIYYGTGLTLIAVAMLLAATTSAVRVAVVALLGVSFTGAAWALSPADLPFSISPAPPLKLMSNRQVHEFMVTPEPLESPYQTVSVVGRFDPKWVMKGGHGLSMQEREALGMKLDPQAKLEMRFNSFVQSSIFVNKPGKPPGTTYTKYLHVGMALNPGAQRLLVLGLGGGSVPREWVDVYASRNDTQVDAVEIDPAVLQLAKRYFDYQEGPRHRSYTTDGRQFVRRKMGRFDKYDAMVLDAFSGTGQIPGHIVTQEYFIQCRERLAPGGVVIANLTAALEGDGSRLFLALYKTLQSVFAQVYAFPGLHTEGQRPGTIILVATNRSEPRLTTNDWQSRLGALQEQFPLLARRTMLPGKHGLKHLVARLWPEDQTLLASAILLTDDYAPVETMHWR